MGAVTPVGIGVENYWNNITAVHRASTQLRLLIRLNSLFRLPAVKNFNPSDYLPKDLIRKTDPFMQYAYIAAEEAMKQSGIKIEPERTGIVMGTAMAVLQQSHILRRHSQAHHTKGRSSFYSQNSRKHCRRKYRNRLQYSGTELYGKHSLFVRR